MIYLLINEFIIYLTTLPLLFQNVELKPGSLVYDEWTKASTPIYMKYYLFNLTNPHEVMEGATPNVRQIGPYSYRYEVEDVNTKQMLS